LGGLWRNDEACSITPGNVAAALSANRTGQGASACYWSGLARASLESQTPRRGVRVIRGSSKAIHGIFAQLPANFVPSTITSSYPGSAWTISA